LQPEISALQQSVEARHRRWRREPLVSYQRVKGRGGRGKPVAYIFLQKRVFMVQAVKRNRFWIEIIVLASVGAFVLALLLATLGAAAAAFAQDANGTASAGKTYQGMVTCSRCGAKHSAKAGRRVVDCTYSCVRAGANFALVDGEKTYQLDGDMTLIKKVVGQRAQITGVAHGTIITVSAAAAT